MACLIQEGIRLLGEPRLDMLIHFSPNIAQGKSTKQYVSSLDQPFILPAAYVPATAEAIAGMRRIAWVW